MQSKLHSKLEAAPTIIYPESDGKPMAETDLHRDLMMDFIETLKHHFREDAVYVSGNLLIYYERGDRTKSVSPDVFVVHGVGKKRRRTYLTWEEGKTPDFVVEVSSRSTYKEDINRKKELYARVLEVEEYYIYDPEGQIDSPFIGYRLVDGEYEEIEFVDSRLPSNVLGLELGEHNETLSLYDPRTRKWLQPAPKRAEIAEARAETAEARAEQEADARQQEADARQTAEAQLAQALAELERLRGQNNH